MNKSQPSQQKPPIPQNPTNNLTTNTITNDNNTKNNRTEIQPSNNTRAMNKSQPSQQKPPIPQKPTNNLTTNTTTNDNNTKNNRTDIQPSNNNKTMNKSQPSQQKPQIPQKPTLNHTANTITNDKNTKNNRTDIKPNNNNSNSNNNKVIWDCGSSLYDSFELDSFRKQIDSAIINSARTLSMPRLPSENNRAPPPPQPLKKQPSSKFSRSFQKLLRSVFRGSKPNKKADNSGNSSPDPWFFDSPVSYEKEEKDGKKVDGGGKYFIVYDKPEVVNGLTTIPEVPEVNYSPEIGSNLVRKTMSERFTSASFGIHCA